MPAPTFLIKNGGSDFMNRQRSIFDVLSAVEEETSLSRTSNVNLMEIDDSQSRSNKRKRTKRFLGKESIFKAPMELPVRFKKPKYIHMRGKRWIKYSLADVSDYDLSNEGNTAAALSFLESLKTTKVQDVKEENEANQKHLFKFNTSNIKKKGDDSETHKAVFKSTKLIMPEYVVGQSKTPKKKVTKSIPQRESSKEVYLDHIHADDNTDEE